MVQVTPLQTVASTVVEYIRSLPCKTVKVYWVAFGILDQTKAGSGVLIVPIGADGVGTVFTVKARVELKTCQASFKYAWTFQV